MKKNHNSRQTVYQILRHFKEWLYDVLTWDAQHGSILFGLLINLMTDLGDWYQMCIDVLMALIEFCGYIVPQ